MYKNKKQNSLIVSPHSDDAVLSLGGSMIKMKGKLTVLNVFSTCAKTILPSINDTSIITEINNQEEKNVMRQLDAKLIMLNFDEALLRGYKCWYDPTNYKRDFLIIHEITKIFLDIIHNYENIYIPLAVGDHIDHKILNDIFTEIFHKGLYIHYNDIFLYEDLPYAYYCSSIENRLDECRGDEIRLEGIFVDITDCIDQKIKILSTYRSQYTESDLGIIKEYAYNIKKDGKYYERFWKVSKDGN